MKSRFLSRRQFLRDSGAVAGVSAWPGGTAALFALAQSACTSKEQAAAFKELSAIEAREFEAIAARIMPTTDTPGAREAGVIYFIDNAFHSVLHGIRDDMRNGLDEFAKDVAARFGGARFSDLPEADQDDMLASIEDTPFFTGLRTLTFCGFFGMSKYGGNRNDAGWKLVGMDPHAGAWQPPFGYYDAEYMEGESNGD
ncbi:MAG: gluconate 2-dehydrogenase subunit 3 family protein [Gammaproteobacteria bacterium]|nr:gluconate 2-dehydrogenase subunit 3 family protein [Gammaproteobacteria bacterium]